MPLAFPSHQGLVLPLWRRLPGRIDGVALCVGAAMPDLVDAAAWPFRGELGQGLGHALVGLLVCTPAGLLLAWLLRRVLPGRWLAPFERGAPSTRSVTRGALSVALGALSHLVTDLVSHANFVLLWPFYVNDHAFPAWWERAWFHVPLLVYREPYPVAPHTLVWLVLTTLGIVLFVRAVRRTLPGT